MKHRKQIADRRARRKGEKAVARRQELKARRRRTIAPQLKPKMKLPPVRVIEIQSRPAKKIVRRTIWTLIASCLRKLKRFRFRQGGED